MRVIEVNAARVKAAADAARAYISAAAYRYRDAAGRIDAVNRLEAVLIERVEYADRYNEKPLEFKCAADVIDFIKDGASSLNQALQSGGYWFMWDEDIVKTYMPKTVARRYTTWMRYADDMDIWAGKSPALYRAETTARAAGNFFAALNAAVMAESAGLR